MKKIVFIERDESNGICLCRDSYRNIMVQVVRFVDQKIPSGPDNEMVNQKSVKAIRQYPVPVLDGEKEDNLKVRSGIDKDLNSAIAKAREYLQGIRKADETIEQILTASLNGNEEINEQEKEN